MTMADALLVERGSRPEKRVVSVFDESGCENV